MFDAIECLYGGVPRGPQLTETPGRLNNILEMRRVTLHQVSYLVLDEAVKIPDLGFEPHIRKIVKVLPSRRQTLMYTATWPEEVQRITGLLVNSLQVFSPMDERKRLEQISRSQEPGSKITIFCSAKKICDLAGNLTDLVGAVAIHGDKSEGQRDHVLSRFLDGSSPVLISTDIVARCLDIRLVINDDFPTGIVDYVNRIGRTGQADATGVPYTFFYYLDSKHASELVKFLEGANQRVPPEVRDMVCYGVGNGMGRGRRWSSGPSEYDTGNGGGRYDCSYSERYGGRVGWGMSLSPDRGGGRDNDHEQQNRHGFGSYAVQDSNATGSLPYKSLHESMVAATKNSHSCPSCGRRTSRKSGCWESSFVLLLLCSSVDAGFIL